MTRILELPIAPPSRSAWTSLVVVALRGLLVAAAALGSRAGRASEFSPVLHLTPPLPPVLLLHFTPTLPSVLQLSPTLPPAIPERPSPNRQPTSPGPDREHAGALPDRNVAVPILEAAVFNFGTWAVDRYALDAEFARVSARTVAANLSGGWTFDTDDFHTNEILHPYMGSVYHTAARSAGWSFGEAVALDFAGSLAWKIAGENTAPSINDQLTTTLGGAILGEVLFRVSRLVLDGAERPGFGRHLAAAVIAPAAAVNDALLHGTIVDPVPARQRYLGSFSVGASTTSAVARTGNVNPAPGAFVGVHLVHGIPGEVELSEPLDHFDFRLDFSSATPEPWKQLDDARGPAWLLTARGLIVGGQDRLGDDGGVLYGLFGTFDYGGPQLLRVSETGFGPGVALATRPASSITLDATLLASVTFGSGGAWTPPEALRDYRYGFGALLLADGRAWVADRLELAAAARGYLVPAAVGGGGELLLLGEGSARLRVAGPHALGVEVTVSRRWADYPGAAYAERATLTSLVYSYLFGGR